MKRLLFMVMFVITSVFIWIGCEDSQKQSIKYHPKDRAELVKLINDENVNLSEIDTSAITDMSYLFARFSTEQCYDVFAEFFKHIESFVIVATMEKAAQKGDKWIPTEADKQTIKDNLIVQWETEREKCIHNARERVDFSGIESWNVANVKDMSYMFGGVENFNEPLGKWNVSRVQNMRGMFGKTAFNQNIQSWNTASVESMNAMFARSTFNQPLNSWNVSKVKDMSLMFFETSHFNQPLNDWDISQVEDMNFMFQKAKSFSQNLESWGERLNPQVRTYLMFEDSFLQSNPPKWYKNLVGQKRE
ncbi:BspA family leucine-rich repeat surface protein [Helicobacter typhlonius]|uniref:BspA family leucine-rich repeat surface protein n=1 Tax=Helicobacter typhlonius TaxID=76936 RepID=UPI002FE32E5C